MPKTCSGFGYGKDKLPEGGSKSFGFSEGGKLQQGLGAKPEHGSGGKSCYRREKTTGLISLQKAGSWWNQQSQYTTKMCSKQYRLLS
jgi:hypothetical protein